LAHDRLLFWRSHPVLYPALAALSVRPYTRVGRTVVLCDPGQVRRFLAQAPIDREGPGTTGQLIKEATGMSTLFVATGEQSRDLRGALVRALGDPDLREGFVRDINPLRTGLVDGRSMDVFPVLRRAVGNTARALLGLNGDSDELMDRIDQLVDAAVREGLGRHAAAGPAAACLGFLESAKWQPGGLLETVAQEHGEPFALANGLTVAIAAATTTLAAGTRALAWCADAGAWDEVIDDPMDAAVCCMNLLTPSPLLPRRVSSDWVDDGLRVSPRDRVLVNLRTACRSGEDATRNLAFGFGPFACPGAALARQQLAILLGSVADLRPRVVRRAVLRGRALPRWEELVLEADR
jgi:cytochrome P450